MPLELDSVLYVGSSPAYRELADQELILAEINPAYYKGDKGKDGLIPIIGDNNNWWLKDPETGEVQDTGQPVTGGVVDYDQLRNKPKINSVELVGDKSTKELDILESLTNQDILDILGR